MNPTTAGAVVAVLAPAMAETKTKQAPFYLGGLAAM
jgi:hypothetical protein